MIEMLGVLAIIGVLSVGGIAGYSKAMLNYKLNKSVEAHRDIIFGLIQYSNRLQPSEGENLINEEVAALGLKPDLGLTRTRINDIENEPKSSVGRIVYDVVHGFKSTGVTNFLDNSEPVTSRKFHY